MKNYLSCWLCCALWLAGCGNGEHASTPNSPDAGAGGDAGAVSESGAGPDAGAAGFATTSPRSDDAGCIISADCAEGAHCDLGECVQDCNELVPCAKGLVCSARGRCLSSTGVDADPLPPNGLNGTVVAEPTSFELAESDANFEVKLSSTAKGSVDYRVEVRAPFLSLVGSERDSFTGNTTLNFKVSTRGLSGALTPGTILVHTNLGNVLVSPSIRVGLSGRYQGVMRYSTGTTAFGDVGIAATLRDDHGDVVMAIDPNYSMTFPSIGGKAAAGQGSFTFSDGLNISVSQAIGADFGGERNHFKRPIARQVAFALAPSKGGRLEGTFKETVYGILAQPIVLQGSAYLEPLEATQSISLEPAPVTTPTIGGREFASIELFPGWAYSTSAFGHCSPSSATEFTGASPGNLATIQQLEDTYYARLANGLAGPRTVDDDMHAFAETCATDLARPNLDDFNAKGSCAYVPPLACALRDVAEFQWRTADEFHSAQVTYNRLFARVLAPALFVAQDAVVEGLKQSFQKGTQAEADFFQRARKALDAPLTFVLASGALQTLKDMPVAIAAGDPTSQDSTATNYPAARALARALYVLNTIDGEQARLDASDLTKTQDAKLALAQQRGVLGLLEGVALSSVVNQWGSPPNLGNEFIGILTLADRGFQTLQQGGVTFGIPDGEIPIASGGPVTAGSNFDLLRELAKPALDIQAADETAFTVPEREFEQNNASVLAELENVRNRFDSEIHDICGPAFPIDGPKTDSDWFTLCGKDGLGQFLELGGDIQLAQGRLQAAQTNLLAMQKKVAIDTQRLADTQHVRAETIAFTDSAGDQKVALQISEGFINIAEKTIEIASHANILNGGAPLGEALAMGMLEAQRTAIQTTRQKLENAQQLRSLTDESDIERINSEAEIQKQLVDMGGASLDIQQEGLSVTLAGLQQRDLLESAKRAFEARTRSLSRISQSPASDPMYRVLASSAALKAVSSRAKTQTWLYRVGRALEYEMNRPLGDALGRAVLGAYNKAGVERLMNCMHLIYNDFAVEFRQPSDYTTTFSVREMLGITGPRIDEVTGAELSEGELFRRAIIKNENFDSQGDLTFGFATNLQRGNPLWSTNVCNDKVSAVQVQLVGDFLGDNQAQVVLGLDGGALLRECDSERVLNWSLSGDLRAAIDAGVNSFGDTNANTFLFGQSVARANWKVTIPSGETVPQNADLHLDRLEDVVIRVKHKALQRKTKPTPIDTSCLSTVSSG
jgi:hypothetical protein